MHIIKGNMKIQLYDLDNDIREQNDVAEKHPEIVKKVEEIMKKEHHTPDVESFRMSALEK
jgi:arylsulfatase